MTTRVVKLDVQGVGDAGEARFPLGIRIFHRDTIFWIRTRVMPQLTLKVVLFHVIDEVARRRVADLPVNLFHYSTFDLAREIPLLPDLQVQDVGGNILFVHESEFVTAFDRSRRVELIADLVNRLEDRYESSYLKRNAGSSQTAHQEPLPSHDSLPAAARAVHGYGSASWCTTSASTHGSR